MGFLSLQTGDQEEQSFPFQMRRLRPRQHLRLAFPGSQGEAGGGIKDHSHQLVLVPHQSHCVFSCSTWLALRLRNDFEVLLVPAPSHPTECRWDSRERGKVSVLQGALLAESSFRPECNLGHSGSQRGRKLWLGLQRPLQAQRASAALKWGCPQLVRRGDL